MREIPFNGAVQKCGNSGEVEMYLSWKFINSEMGILF